jgi:hypothetical protein
MEGRITSWSPGMQRRYGSTQQVARGQTSHQLLRTTFLGTLQEIEATLVNEIVGTPITLPDELSKHESSNFCQATWQLVSMFAAPLVLGIDDSGRMPCERGIAPHSEDIQ